MQGLIYKWKNMTRDVANELWIARVNLKAQGQRIDLTSAKNCRSWSGYCEEIGISHQSANNWLNKWFPEQLNLGENKPIIVKANANDWLKEQDPGRAPGRGDIEGDGERGTKKNRFNCGP